MNTMLKKKHSFQERLKQKGPFLKVTEMLIMLGVLLAMTLPGCYGQEIPQPDLEAPTILKEVRKSNNKTTRSEGLLLEQPPTYIEFTGKDGLDLSISLGRQVNIDYTLMFWFRSSQSLADLETDPSILNKRAYLFELAGGAGCYITRTEEIKDEKLVKGGPWLRCDPGPIEIPLSALPNIQSWMHLTYSATYVSPLLRENDEDLSSYYVRIDDQNFHEEKQTDHYLPILDRHAYYGCGAPDETTGIPKEGFKGDYRQFWLTQGKLLQEKIPLLMHQYKVMDFSTLAYYRFEETTLQKREQDSFRQQKYSLITIDNDSISEQIVRQYGKAPKFVTEDVAAPFCNSIPQKYLQVPQFLRGSGDKYKGIDLPTFDYDQKQIQYTASFWMKNFGKHTFSSNPKAGRERNQIFSLDECFTVYYSSQTTFNIYVYAQNNFDEVNSDPIFLPLYEWVNIQISIHYETGIEVMTFNQNGDMMQSVKSKVRLAEQYPAGTLSLFQAFEGVPYQLDIWERFIKLPIDLDAKNLATDQIVSFLFTKDNYEKDRETEPKFEGWRSLVQGGDLRAVEGDGFDFIYSNVPSGVDFDPDRQTNIGQLDTEETQWNGVTCPTPETNLMYLSGLGAKFAMAVAVDTTDELTIEFWVRPDVAEFAQKKTAQLQTYLFMMQGRIDPMSGVKDPDTMVVYVDDGVLKCAPFGISDQESVLTLEGVNPLTVDKWQHISCSMRRQKFVKCEYLAVNINTDTPPTPVEDFQLLTLRPQVFAKSIYRKDGGITLQNFSSEYRWNVILGNKAVESAGLFFYGSFKDVRIWKSMRQDADLYSYRFNQVPISDDLACNLKFMDGNPNIYNNALLNKPGLKFAVIEPSMELRATDGQNLICATDTYFDPIGQMCSRNPYSSDAIIAYTVENSVQHGHNMIMQQISQSTMFLPSEKFQPKTSTKWSVEDQEALNIKYFDLDDTKQSYNFDPIFMGDFKPYNFKLEITDVDRHDFFVHVDQTIVPRKCILIVDELTDNSQTTKSVFLRDPESISDLTFKFSVKRIDGCKDEFSNKLVSLVEILTQPPLPPSAIDRIQQSFDEQAQSFTVTIPKELQLDNEIPKNIPIVMVMRLFWQSEGLDTTDDQNAAAVSYQDTIYTVTLAEEIFVDFSYEGGQIIDVSGQQDLTISSAASYSVLDKARGTAGLTFKWSCKVQDAVQGAYPGLQSACEHWNGSSVLVIPMDLALAQGILNVPVIVTVTVSSIEASVLEGSAAQAVQFSKSRTFTWISNQTPNFNIVLPQSDDVVLVSQSQQILIEPLGSWKPIDGYQFEYYVSLKGKPGQRLAISFDLNFNIFTIPAYVLEYESTYELQVTVSNPEQGTITPQTNIKEFTTGSQPVLTGMTIEPKSGLMYDTEFTVTLNGIDKSPKQPLSFVLYGVINQEPLVELRLTNRVQLDSDKESHEHKMTLPVLVGVRVEVQDPTGEVFSIDTSVAVEQGEQTWAESLQQQQLIEEERIQQQEANQLLFEAQETDLTPGGQFELIESPPAPTVIEESGDTIWQTYQFIGAQANVDARLKSQDADPEVAQKAVQDAINVNKIIADNAFNGVREIFLESEDPKEAEKLSTIVSTIEQTTQYNEFLDLDMLQKNVETLEYSLRFENLMPQINKNEIARKEFVSAVGSVMSATATKAQVEQFQAKYRLENGEDAPVIVWTTESRRLQAENSAVASEIQRALQDNVGDDEISEETVPVPPESETNSEESETTSENVTNSENETTEAEEVTDSEANEEEKVEDELVTYESQSLVDYRKLIRKMIVVKNKHLDQLCGVLKNDERMSIQTGQLEAYAQQILVDNEGNYLTNPSLGLFISEGQLVSIQVPLNSLMKRSIEQSKSREAFGESLEWVCVQASFIKADANPVAGYEVSQQYYHKGQYIVQIGSLDNLQERQISETGLTGLEEDPFEISFKMELTEENKVFDGQTVCGHFNGNQKDMTGQQWSVLKYDAESLEQQGQTALEDCATIYKQPDQLVCRCSYLTNFYYTVITDLDLALNAKQAVNSEKTRGVLYAVLIPLGLIGLFMPIIMIILDQRDYQRIEDNIYPVDDYTIAKLERARDYLCKQQIYYNEKEISRYLQLREGEFRSGSCSAFSIFHRTLHPYFSLFTRFDYRFKRLTRFSFFVCQMSLVTLLMWLAYSREFEERGYTEWMGPHKWLLVSLCLSILMLPLPMRCCCWFKTQMYLVKQEKIDFYELDDEEHANLAHAAETQPDDNEAAENNNEAVTNSMRMASMRRMNAGANDVPIETELMTEPEWEDVRPALFDRWLQCKLVGILCIYIIWGTTIYVTYILSDKATDNTLYFDSGFIQLTAEEASEFIWCWYFAIFVWGFLINELRIGLITLLAPNRAIAIFEKREKLMLEISTHKKSIAEAKNGQEILDKEKETAAIEATLEKFDKSYWTKCSVATCVFIPPESVEIALDVIYTVDIKKMEADREFPKYEVKKEDWAKFEKALANLKRFTSDDEDNHTSENRVQFDSTSKQHQTSSRGLQPSLAAVDIGSNRRISARTGKSLLRQSTKAKGGVPQLDLPGGDDHKLKKKKKKTKGKKDKDKHK